MVKHYRYDFIGLSTDTKPTPETSEKVADGSTYYTSDDSKLYVWYNDQWYEKNDPNAPTPYTLPIATSETLGGVKVGEGLAINSETGVLSAAGGSGPTVVQDTGTSTTNVMSQNAVTSMVYVDPSSKRQIHLGHGATAPGTNSVSIGRFAEADGTGALAIGGADTSGDSDKTRALGGATVAIGKAAQATSPSCVAIGFGAKAQNSLGAVALGPYSSASSAGEINIGSTFTTYGYNSTNYRLLTGVHDPVNAHDAATKGYVDGLISAIESRLTAGGL